MKQLITPSDAEALILKDLKPSPAIKIPLIHALGGTLREPLRADRDFPPFDRVTMDGIAFRAADHYRDPLRLQNLHPAGAPAPDPLLPNHCFQIMTGAILPSDCDTIVPYEELTLTETHATVRAECEIKPGDFIHRQASDASRGTLLVPAQTRLTAAHLGLAASIGASTLTVTQAPKIHIFTTGDELVPLEQTPLNHQLRRSNGITLEMALQTWGKCDVQNTHLPDDLAQTKQALAAAIPENDFIILSGGISKGKKDYVRPALESLIGPPVFHGVAQRPGKPLAFWSPRDNQAAVFALPGNPNSTLMTFHRYLIPALERISDLPPRTKSKFPLTGTVPSHPKLTQFLPTSFNHEGELTLLCPQNSGDFLTPLSATHFIEIPPGSPPQTAVALPLS